MKRRYKAILMIAFLVGLLCWIDWTIRSRTIDCIVNTIESMDARSMVQSAVDSKQATK